MIASYSLKNEMADEQNTDVIYGLFEWNAEKARRNVINHGVTFEEAAEIFDDPLNITFSDLDHSFNESRFIIIGLSGNFRLLPVIYAEREKIRLISARQLTTKERNDYERKRPKFR